MRWSRAAGGLLAAVLLVGGCSANEDEATNASVECSVFRLSEESPSDAMASLRVDDIEQVIASRDPSLAAEGPMDAADWDLVIRDATGVEPRECSAGLIPDATELEVVVTGSTPSDADWAVLVATSEDLTDVETVRLNGIFLDIRR